MKLICLKYVLINIIISALLLLCADSRAQFDSLRHKLALTAFTATNNSHKSMVVSPLLLRFPLCKLALYTKGNAKKELLTALGLRAETRNCYTSFAEVMSPLKDMDLIFVNKIIVNYTNDISPNFVTNQSLDGVRAEKVGFVYPNLALSYINRWVARTSYRRITDLLEPTDINKSTFIVIINAAYLKPTWEFPFDITSTRSMRFHHHNGNISWVQMMKKTETFSYLSDDTTGTKYVNIKLASIGLSMTIAIPESSRGLSVFLYWLSKDPNYMKNIYKRMRNEYIDLMLPRFRIKTRIKLGEHLQRIGLKEIFNKTSNALSGILKPNSKIKNISVDTVIQKNFIDVDEMGIYRRNPKQDMYQEPFKHKTFTTVEVLADRPFYFTVNLQPDMLNFIDLYDLLTGVYYGPDY